MRDRTKSPLALMGKSPEHEVRPNEGDDGEPLYWRRQQGDGRGSLGR